jgi:hypothetical protein
MFKISSFPRLCLLIFALALPTQAQDIGSAWKLILKNCIGSQIVGKDVLFFGASNKIGLGSVWRKTGSKGYNPRFEFSELIPAEEARNRIIKLGETIKYCEGGEGTKWNFKLGLPVVLKILGHTGLETDFRRAKQASVIVEAVALDVIKEVPLQEEIRNLLKRDPTNPYAKDLLAENRLLVIKSFRITGFAVRLDYDPKLLEELKGKYPEGGSVSIGGDKGLTAALNYSGDSHLTVKLNSDAYLAGEFARVKVQPDKQDVNVTKDSRLPIFIQPVKISPVDSFRIRPR